jgi:hypothetical protein
MMDFVNRKTGTFGALVLAFSLNAVAVDIKIDDGNVLTAADIENITIDDENNVVLITTLSGDFTINQEDGGGGGSVDPTPVVSLSASAASVLEGSPVTLDWDISLALSCSTSLGNAEWRTVGSIALTDGASDSSAAVTVDFIGAVTFQLTCINGSKTTTRSVIITGEEEPVVIADGCPAEYSPSLAGDLTPWGDFFVSDFPGPKNQEPLMGVRRAGYRSLEFNTGENSGQDGSIRTWFPLGRHQQMRRGLL